MSIFRLLKPLMMALAAFVLVACGGSDVGPGDSLLIGDWVQQGEIVSGGGAVRMEGGRVSYAKDGTSRFISTMVLLDPTLSEDMRRYTMTADVTWTLEETILTRTLQTMSLTPMTVTDSSAQLAAAYEQGLSQSPPARYIVETLDAATMVLLDPETGATLTYTR